MSSFGTPSHGETPPRIHRRLLGRLPGLLKRWWSHRVTFTISLVVTLSAVLIYVFTFVGEHPNPAPFFEFVQRLELNTLDTRFRYRGSSHNKRDDHIVIVDIDQRSQEVLGRWPFSRTNFANMLDALREDGAKVVAFDVTFSKPDEVAAPIRDLRQDLRELRSKGAQMDPRFAAKLEQLEAKYNSDGQFATAIERFGGVVLGNFFLYSHSDLEGLDEATLEHYAQLLSFFTFPHWQPLRPEAQQQDFSNLVDRYKVFHLVPQGAQANVEILADALTGDRGATGFFTVPADTDGVVRHSLLALPYSPPSSPEDWALYASLDVQAVRLYLGMPSDQPVLLYGPQGIARLEFGPTLVLHPDDVGRAMINYHGPVRTYPYKSIADVVQHNFRPGFFRDKIVLVGASATGIGDVRPTPYGGLDFPGVEIHANVIDNILHQNFLQRGGPQILSDLGFILLFGLPVGLWLALVRPQNMWLALWLAVPFLATVYVAFLKGSWLTLTIPLLTLVANVSLVALYRVIVEEREKRRVRGNFQQYLSPEVIRRLLESPELVRPRKTEITIMFSDIRGFTTISEKLDAQELAEVLNEYLSDMTRIVFSTKGTLDKYIGDAVMAFWGAPFEERDHAIRACHAALAMMKRVGEIQQEWKEAGRPAFDIGVGINTGIASVGNMGSSLRYGYTAMGDAVNLSSRLEGLNKEYRTHIILGEAAYKDAKDASFLFRELDLIQVKGKLQPVTIYELVDLLTAESQHKDRLDTFARGRASYARRKWQEAQDTFQEVLDRWPDDGPSRTYWKRCQEYLFEEPSENWDGVFVMTHK